MIRRLTITIQATAITMTTATTTTTSTTKKADIYREYPAKRNKRKRHNSALEKDNSNLKKVLESPVKTILPCFDRFRPPIFFGSP